MNTELAAQLWEWAKGLGLAVIGLLAWIYRQDRQRMDSKLEKHSEEIASIDASRPRRSELTEAVMGLRAEVRADLLAIKEEVRVDLASLRSDTNARLDILIKLTKEQSRD